MANETIVLEGRSRRAIEQIAKFGPVKIRMDESVDETTRKIVRSYGRAWQVARGEARKMAEYAAEQSHAGRGLSARDVANLDRVDRGLHALERQVRKLSGFTGVTVSGQVKRTTEARVDEVLRYLTEVTGIDRAFTKPSGNALQALILRSTGRIEAASRRLDAETSTALKDGLMRGLLHGDNPVETAREIYRQTEGAFLGGRSRATTIARTELMDAYRYSHKAVYNESELVRGWKWLAALDGRTCPACWAMHNTFHDKTETQWAHQNCRCTQVPVMLDDEPEDVNLGNPEELFWKQPREVQLQIMGPGRLTALEGGALWSDLVYLKQNPGWRPSVAVTRVSDLTGLAELSVAETVGDVITIPEQTNASVLSATFDGGMTIHALTGDQPTSGFAVARKGTSKIIDAREFFTVKGPKQLADWMRLHGDRLDEPGAHVGIWYDKDNGKVVLDVVEILNDRDAAIALGRAEDQIAIFDLGNFDVIETGGTGGYAQSLELPLSKADVGRTATIVRDGAEVTGEVVVAGAWGIRIRTPDGAEVNAAPGQFFFGEPGTHATDADVGREVVTDQGTKGTLERVVDDGEVLVIKRQDDGGVIFKRPSEVTFTSQRKQAVVDRIQRVQQIAARADHGIRVDYSGAEPESAQELDDSLDDLVADWEGVAPISVVVQPNKAGAFATTHTDPLKLDTGRPASNIEVDESSAGNYRSWSETMTEAEERGHFHRGTGDEPAEYTIDHEFGHVLDFAVFGKPRAHGGGQRRSRALAEVYNELFAEEIQQGERVKELTGSDLAFSAARPEEMASLWSDPEFQDRITADLSYYATQSQHELIAEAFAVYRDHGPGESVVADTVMKHLVMAYRDKYGAWPSQGNLGAIFEEVLSGDTPQAEPV